MENLQHKKMTEIFISEDELKLGRGWTSSLIKENLTPDHQEEKGDVDSGLPEDVNVYSLRKVREAERNPAIALAIKENRESRHPKNIQRFQDDWENREKANKEQEERIKRSIKEGSTPKNKIFLTTTELEKRGWTFDLIKEKLAFCKTANGYQLDKVRIAESDPDFAQTLKTKRFCTQQNAIDDWEQNVVSEYLLFSDQQ